MLGKGGLIYGANGTFHQTTVQVCAKRRKVGIVVDLACGNLAAKVDIRLVEITMRVVKFVNQARCANAHRQARFLHHFADQVVGQGTMQFCTTPGRAP